MNKKLLFYARYGVEEYYIYDPQKNDLSGWLRSSVSAAGEFPLQVIEQIEGWVSPRLDIRFDTSGEELRIYRSNKQAFATYVEIQKQLEQAQERVQQAEQRLQEMEDLLKQYRDRFGDLPK